MSYHIEGDGGFKNLPERILVREDGYMGAYKFYGEPIVDHWYVPEAENAKLRETLCDIADHIKSDDGYGIDRGWVLERIRETGIEVPE